MAGQDLREDQDAVDGYVGTKREHGDGDGGAYCIQAVAAHQHAVDRPADRRAHEQQVAAPDAAAVQGMQQAGPTHQQAAAHNQDESGNAPTVQPLAQHQYRQQRGPQGQPAWQQHRAVRSRRKRKPAIGKAGVQRAAKKTGHHRHAKRQRREATKGMAVHHTGRPVTPRQPPAPGRQHRKRAADAGHAHVQRQQQCATRRIGAGAGDDDERCPDQHGHQRRQQTRGPFGRGGGGGGSGGNRNCKRHKARGGRGCRYRCGHPRDYPCQAAPPGRSGDPRGR